ncbi:hairy-related 11 [Paramisgurnus dabryanus]|uniref:hairy-related 11 n=1 Tax=Paramisgurnus dabryanus TaxID=90735 RepID=UPI0031F3C748
MQQKAVQILNMAKTEGIKRKLKPVIEKKRRDRINHNLDALKDLLFKTTADTRLQNPKLEKAEILDLAVQYIRKTTRKMESKVTLNQMDSKATKNQSVISLSVGSIDTSDTPAYALDIYGTLNPSEAFPKQGGNHGITVTCASRIESNPAFHENIDLLPSGQNHYKELLLHPESSLYGCKLSPASYYNSPPSSPTFNSVFPSPTNSPPYSSVCPLPLSFPPPPLTAASLSLHRPVTMPQPFLPHTAKDFTPPQSPIMSTGQELNPPPAQNTWRPWS